MSEEAIIQDDLTAKESRFGALKTAILVVLGLLIIGIVSSTILYFTNSGVKTNIDALAKRVGLFQPKSESELQVDTRIKELSSYYLSLDIPRAADKLYALKQEDKKLYEELLSDDTKTLPTPNEKIMISKDPHMDFDEIDAKVNCITKAALRQDKIEVVRLLKEIVREFKSNNSIYEVLDK